MSDLVKNLRKYANQTKHYGSIGAMIEAADLIEQQQKSIAELEAQLKEPEWIILSDKKPDVLKVRVKLSDGSEVNCWAQSDGDFYWKGGGSEMFILEHKVTHWMPLPEPPKGE